jgi:biofilm PGA synthesis N-glycosyltransferase PgaC
MREPNYVIITPARNEEPHLPKTIESVASQTLQPQQWILVNDGSTDDTGRIMDRAARQHSWMKAVHRSDRGFRKSGGGVIEAFYDGYAQLPAANPQPSTSSRSRAPHSTLSSQPSTSSWDYLVKLDADLSFDASYFSDCFERFDAEPKLGIGGGTICGLIDGVLVAESGGDPSFHVRGATKIYRRACWEAIGGLMQAPGWDSLDELKANLLGWKTSTFRDLKLHQHRQTGDADGSWKNWVKNGLANYITGYHPAFMLVKCVRRGLHTGSVTIPFGLGWGFLSGYLKGVPQAEPEVIRYVRQQQIRRLLLKPSLWS